MLRNRGIASRFLANEAIASAHRKFHGNQLIVCSCTKLFCDQETASYNYSDLNLTPTLILCFKRSINIEISNCK